MKLFQKTTFTSLDEALLRPKNCEILELVFRNEDYKYSGDKFSQLINLKKLFIQDNINQPYFELPEEIAGLRNLKSLDVLNYSLKEYPEWINEIKQLEYLMLRGNDIAEIPESIVNLDKLQTLRIENCDLHKLPSSLKRMKNLKHIGLCDTKLTDLSPEQFPMHLKTINFSGRGKYDERDLDKLKKVLRNTTIYP